MRTSAQLRKPTKAEALNLKKMRAYRPEWKWDKLQGSAACLKWAFRDLEHLDAILRYVPGRKTAIQAGGNLGLFPKRLAEEFATVYTLEPSPDLYAKLCANAPEPNIIRLNAALGENHDTVGVKCARRDDSGRAVHEGLTHIVEGGNVPQLRIDDLCVEACDLIYLDIEGYELRALKGAEETIKKFRPVIVVEINKSIEHYGATGDELRGWLRARAYARFAVHESDEAWEPAF